MRFEFEWDPAKAESNRRKHSVAFEDAIGVFADPLAAAKSDSTKKGDLMKDEYDFSSAARGKFFREGARLVPPVHLDPEVLDYLSERASARGVSLSSLVNTLLKKDIELIDAGK